MSPDDIHKELCRITTELMALDASGLMLLLAFLSSTSVEGVHRSLEDDLAKIGLLEEVGHAPLMHFVEGGGGAEAEGTKADATEVERVAHGGGRGGVLSRSQAVDTEMTGMEQGPMGSLVEDGGDPDEMEVDEVRDGDGDGGGSAPGEGQADADKMDVDEVVPQAAAAAIEPISDSRMAPYMPPGMSPARYRMIANLTAVIADRTK